MKIEGAQRCVLDALAEFFAFGERNSGADSSSGAHNVQALKRVLAMIGLGRKRKRERERQREVIFSHIQLLLASTNMKTEVSEWSRVEKMKVQ